MRRLLFLMVLCVCANLAAAQEETLFQGPMEKGGFGGPVVKYTAIKGQGALMIGGRGGWVLNHALVLGGGGYGIVTEVDADADVWPEEGPLDIEFGYGGFEVEYIVHPNSLAHVFFYNLIGGGTARYVADVGPVSESNDQVGASDSVFVLEPAAGAELNVTDWFHVQGAVSYRLVSGVNRVGLQDKDLSGAAGTLAFKFGHF
jgi:hypothetical protein